MIKFVSHFVIKRSDPKGKSLKKRKRKSSVYLYRIFVYFQELEVDMFIAILIHEVHNRVFYRYFENGAYRLWAYYKRSSGCPLSFFNTALVSSDPKTALNRDELTSLSFQDFWIPSVSTVGKRTFIFP